jgi:hypothetical protein
MVLIIQEGKAASKSPHKKCGYFISTSQHAVSVDSIPNSAVGNFPKKPKEQRHK